LAEGLGGEKRRLKERMERIARRTRSTIGWSLAAILVIVVVGCSGLSDEKPEQVINPLKLKPVTLNFYTRLFADRAPESEEENFLKSIEGELADALNISLVFHWVPYENYYDEISKLVTSGEAVDAFTCYSPRQHVANDSAMDITDLFPRYMPEYSKLLNTSAAGELILRSASINGRLYMIPSYSFYFDRLTAIVSE
jgi:ABC-type glycerol-3-phosphate transport system substrate-binding protein